MSEEERIGGEEGSVYEDAISNCMDAEDDQFMEAAEYLPQNNSELFPGHLSNQSIFLDRHVGAEPGTSQSYSATSNDNRPPPGNSHNQGTGDTSNTSVKTPVLTIFGNLKNLFLMFF